MRLFMQEWHWAVVVHVVHSSEYLAAAYSCPATPTGSAVYTEQVDCAAVNPPPLFPPFGAVMSSVSLICSSGSCESSSKRAAWSGRHAGA